MFKAKIWSRSLLAVGVLTATPAIFVGCGAGDTPVEPQQASALRAPFDGEVAFRGLFFGVGPVADRLSPLWNNAKLKAQIGRLTAQSPEAQAEAIETAVTKMQADGWSLSSIANMKQLAKDIRAGLVKEPTAEQQLATQEFLIERIRSADPGFFARFGTAVQSGDHVRIERSIEEASRLLRVAMDTGLSPSQDLAAKKIIYTKVAIATRAAVAAIIIVLAIAIVWVHDPSSDSSVLAREEFVAHVAKALAAQ